MDSIKLGSRVKDTITGFEGVASGRYENLRGTVRFEVEALDKNGKPLTEWFDDVRLVDATPAPQA